MWLSSDRLSGMAKEQRPFGTFASPFTSGRIKVTFSVLYEELVSEFDTEHTQLNSSTEKINCDRFAAKRMIINVQILVEEAKQFDHFLVKCTAASLIALGSRIHIA